MPAGMPSVFLYEDATAVECKTATWAGCDACYEHTHTHTHVNTLGVLAQRFVCESHAAVSNLESCYLTGHLVQARQYKELGDTASGLLRSLPLMSPVDRAPK
jgi:hypothetical protein